MKILKTIAVIILILSVAVVAYLGYLGIFSKMEITVKQMGPYKIAYEKFTGPYTKTKPVFDKVYAILKENNLTPTRGIGIYYDDPATVEADKLHSECGSIIEKNDLPKLVQLKGKVTIADIIQSKAIVTTFPIKGTLSYMVGPMKAYPALTAYATEHNLKLAKRAYEIYDMPAKTIYYVFEILE